MIVLSRDSSGKILTAELSQAERERGRENYDFYCFLIWPFIESTWLAAVSLMSLSPPSKAEENVWIDIKQAQEKAQLVSHPSPPFSSRNFPKRLRQAGKTLYHQGDLSYFEAVNKETIKNAYQLFEDEGMIIHHRSPDPKLPSTVKLASEWMPTRDETTGSIVPQGKLWQFTEMIARSRREG